MKKIAVICLLLAALRASGDVVVVEQTQAPRSQPYSITTTIKDGKCRKDFPNDTSTIYDIATGDITRINHAAKSYSIFSKSQTDAVVKLIQNTTGSASLKPPVIVDTGKTEKVDGHDSEVYTSETPEATYTFWVTKDFPDYAAINGETEKFQERSRALDNGTDYQPDPSKLDGMVIKSQRLTGSGQVTTVTLVSAKLQTVDDAELQVPAGYTDTTQHVPISQ